MLTIPLIKGINQTFSILLAGQLCRITIYQNSTGLYMDLSKDGLPVRNSVMCLDRVKMISEEYRGFIGMLMFEDTRGKDDPTIDGLGDRYQLRYLEKGIDF